MKQSRPPTTRLTAPRTSFQWRVISQALILTAFIIVILTTIAFIISRGMIERAVRTQIASVASMAETSLESTLHGHRERGSLLGSNADIRSVLNGQAGSFALGGLLALLQRDQPALEGIELYLPDGKPQASAGVSIGLPDNALKTPVQRANVTDKGWITYDVATPVWGSGNERIGIIVMRYRMDEALSSILSALPAVGQTASLYFARTHESLIEIIDPVNTNRLSMEVDSVTEALSKTLNGEELIERSSDFRGHDVLAATRYLPTLGWALTVQVDRAEALADVRRLAYSHAIIGTLLLFLSAALAYLLARQVTLPLRTLSQRVQGLRPGAWKIKRSVFTDDEVEMLDEVVVDMANRLHGVYHRQEVVIEERTEELQRQYALDRAILSGIDLGVLTVDRDGIITNANPAACRLLGMGANESLAKDIERIFQLRSHRRNAFDAVHPVRECLLSGAPVRSPVNSHISILLPDDSLLPIMYAVSPLVLEKKVFGAVVVFQDISEERRLDYLKSEFISLASHQLRTPLSALRWYVELFLEEKKSLTKDQNEYLQEMQSSIDRMVALLTSLLHAAHMEGDNLEPDIRRTDVAQIMREMSEDCMGLLHERALQCDVKAPKRPLIVQTDPTLLRIILQNMMSNAVKYTPQGTKEPITLSLSSSPRAITLSVSDKGMGIPEGEQPRVFQKFFRARNVRKADTDGNGLGLYITRSIVERLGGTIRFASQENKGTTFTVTLPRSGKRKKA